MRMFDGSQNWRKEQIRCFDSEPLFSRKEMKAFETEAEYLDALDEKTVEMIDDSAAKIVEYLAKAKAELSSLNWAMGITTSVPKSFKVSKGDQLKRVINQNLNEADSIWWNLDEASKRVCEARNSIRNYHDISKTVVFMKDRDDEEELDEVEKMLEPYKINEYRPKSIAKNGHYEWSYKSADQKCRKCPICGEWVDKELDCCSNGHMIDDRVFSVDIEREIKEVPNFYQTLSNRIMKNTRKRFDPNRIYFFETLHSPRGFLSSEMCEPPSGYGLRVDKKNEKLELIYFEMPYPEDGCDRIKVYKDGSICEKNCDILPMFTISKGMLKVDLRCPVWKLADEVQEDGVYHFFMSLEDVLREDGIEIWKVVTEISEQLEAVTYLAQFEEWYGEWDNEWEERGKGFDTRYDILARENGEYMVWPNSLSEEEKNRLWDMKEDRLLGGVIEVCDGDCENCEWAWEEEDDEDEWDWDVDADDEEDWGCEDEDDWGCEDEEDCEDCWDN